MKFDPTHIYSTADLNDDYSITCWRCCELIKTLVTLSYPAEKQKEIIGAEAVPDEMAIDFESYFTLAYKEYLKHNLLTKPAIERLLELDQYFDARSGTKYPAFWNERSLHTLADWAEVRLKAKEILALLGYEDLEIQFDRTEKVEETERGKVVTVQTTHTRLVDKSA